MKPFAKLIARALSTVAVWPLAVSVSIRGAFIGRDLAFQHTTEWLALLPGLIGQDRRRAFLDLTTEGCGSDVVIGTGTTFVSTAMRIDGNAYLGNQCNVAGVHIERDALVGTGVHILTGPRTHGTGRMDIPIREQPGEVLQVTIREGAWLGNGAIVMADVGRHAIVAAGAVVTSAVPDFAIVAGVPARAVRDRRDPSPSDGTSP